MIYSINDLSNKLYSDMETSSDRNELILDRAEVVAFYKDVRLALFINYYKAHFTKQDIENILFSAQLHLKHAFGHFYPDYESKIKEFFDKLYEVKQKLVLDVKAMYDGDPASNSLSEIVLSYPGFITISAYRIAHEFYNLGLKFLARVITEYAHGRTGIDINPGAQIGDSFFIDHGTGIVIGETAIIGNNVKIYQGVTIGALSLKDGHNLKDTKRHPTIKDNVTIYSNASILGGKTIIGNNVVVGGGVFLTKSVDDNMICKLTPCGVETFKNNNF